MPPKRKLSDIVSTTGDEPPPKTAKGNNDNSATRDLPASSTPTQSSTTISADKGKSRAISPSATPPTPVNEGEGTDDSPTSDEHTFPVNSNGIVCNMDYSPKLMQRIVTVLNWQDPNRNTFSVCWAPDDLRWPQELKSKNFSLSRAADTCPVLFWIIGTVLQKWFYEAKDTPARRISVTIVPSSYEAFRAARSLLVRFGGDGQPDYWKEGIHTARWQSGWDRDETASTGRLFTSVYDAKDEFRNKEHMTKLSPAYIQEGDTVLAEATMTSYDHKGKGRRAYFNLQSLSLFSETKKTPETRSVDHGFTGSI